MKARIVDNRVTWTAAVAIAALALLLPVVGCAPTAESAGELPTRLQALHVTMRDGVRIAIDVWLPEELQPGDQVPTLLRMTRYWRAPDIVGAGIEGDDNYDTASQLGAAGYAYVIVDARGTGASFGTRDYVTTQDEVKDYGEVVDWIASQPWSNGRVGSFGVSYDGTTAEMVAVNGHPALKAVAPLYPDFNAFDHLIYPGNVFLNFFTDDWGHAVWMMDQNDICGLRGLVGDDCEAMRAQVRGVKPVDADADGSLLAAAVAEHATNIKVADAARSVQFKDDPFGTGPARVDLLSTPSGHLEQLEASGMPVFSRVGWLDAATVNGALSRFNSLGNPQRVVIGALSHGGGHNTDPFAPPDQASDPSREAQMENLLAFFDEFLKEEGSGQLRSEVTYVTLGSGEWSTTSVWPPEGFEQKTFYFGVSGTLVPDPPAATGSDRYQVDTTATTGRTTRWHTNMGGGDVLYPDRREEDRKLLTYTSEPMASDIEITGHPIASLWASSSHDDGAFFVYLEDVAPDGTVTYISEGQLRAISRKVSEEEPLYHLYGPHHTFLRTDAEPLTPGEPAELSFDLWATSVLIREGHRIRVAIAGADDGNFADYPLDGGVPTIEMHRSARHPSRIVLPIRER